MMMSQLIYEFFGFSVTIKINYVDIFKKIVRDADINNLILWSDYILKKYIYIEIKIN